MSTRWIVRWNYEIAAKATRPGIWRLKTGGFLVRVRVTEPRSGRRVSITRALHSVRTVEEAQAERDRLKSEGRADVRGEGPLTTPFDEYATSLLQQKILLGKLQSQATREWWRDALKVLIPAFQHLAASDIRRQDINHWLRTEVAGWMSDGRVTFRKRRVKGKLVDVEFRHPPSPRTVNGWLRVLRAICHAAKDDFDLHRSAFDGVQFFEEPRAYTREAPNTLAPEVLPRFVAKARELYPQHYAMIVLGLATGLRPSTLRPLRRKGRSCDVLWETGKILVRRSNARGQAVMDQTKTKKDQDIALPSAVMDVLRAHADALPEGPMRESDLLFPSTKGTLQARTALAKPFDAICSALGDELGYRVTPRAMRRTFNDAARHAGVHDVVTRSVSGHVTESMQRHYSTAHFDEQRRELGRVFDLITSGRAPDRKGENEGESDDDERA